MPRISRRNALRQMAALTPAAVAAGCAAPNLLLPRPGTDLIRRENERPGTRDWMLTSTRVDRATGWRSQWIEGYCSHTRVRPGDTLTFHVSTDPAEPFDIEFYRLGWYGGDGDDG